MGPLGWFIGGIVARDLMGSSPQEKPKFDSDAWLRRHREEEEKKEQRIQKMLEEMDEEDQEGREESEF